MTFFVLLIRVGVATDLAAHVAVDCRNTRRFSSSPSSSLFRQDSGHVQLGKSIQNRCERNRKEEETEEKKR